MTVERRLGLIRLTTEASSRQHPYADLEAWQCRGVLFTLNFYTDQSNILTHTEGALRGGIQEGALQ